MGHKLKGKSYISNKLEFKGEYLFDIKWNGTGFDTNGNKNYEIKDGHGKLKEYNYEGNIIFEGEYLNRKKKRKRKRIF